MRAKWRAYAWSQRRNSLVKNKKEAGGGIDKYILQNIK